MPSTLVFVSGSDVFLGTFDAAGKLHRSASDWQPTSGDWHPFPASNGDHAGVLITNRITGNIEVGMLSRSVGMLDLGSSFQLAIGEGFDIVAGGRASNQWMFYYRSAGIGRVVRLVPGGGAVADNTGWRTTWTDIVYGRFTDANSYSFMFYDKTAGDADVVLLNSDGFASLDHTNNGFRTSWDNISVGHFIPGGDQVLLYDKSAGDGDIVSFNGGGALNRDTQSTGWRTTWEMFAIGRFTGNDRQQALIYDRNAGEADIIGFNDDGGLVLDTTSSGWRTSWKLLGVGDFLGNGRDQVVLYDRAAGEVDIVGFDGSGRVNLDVTNPIGAVDQAVTG